MRCIVTVAAIQCGIKGAKLKMTQILSQIYPRFIDVHTYKVNTVYSMIHSIILRYYLYFYMQY